MATSVDRALERGASEPQGRRSWRHWRPRWSLTHTVMVTAAVLAFLLSLAVLRDRNTPIFVAAVPESVPAGTALSAVTVEFSEWRGAPPEVSDYLATRDWLRSFDGLWAAVDITAGVPIRRSDLTDIVAGPPSRIMTLNLDRAQPLAVPLIRGDLVDVIAVEDDRAAYVVTAARVEEAADRSDAMTGVVRTLTLTVDAAESLRLARALSAADIYVVRATGLPPADLTATYPPLRVNGEG